MPERVLVVEDSQTMNNIISKKLSSLGYQVDQAFSLAEADNFLSSQKYEFIVLDLHLPDGEGIDLIMSIQSITDSKIIVLTSLKDDYTRQELFKYGILDYIVKDANLNYSIEELVKLIKKAKEDKKEKILIVDDSKFVCNQVKRILSPRNYVVLEANNGSKGLEILDKESVSLIVLDITLPDINGIDLLAKIRSKREYIDTPIIVLSGTADADTVRKILKNGANEYIKKPFVFEEFILKVDFWIDYYRQKKELIQKKKELEEINKNLEERIKEEVEKNLEKDRMLFAQARLAQMGEVIAIVSHQWKQPLNALSAVIGRTYLKFKRDKQISEEDFQFCYENVSLQLESLSDTIHSFMKFFKPDNKEEVFNLYERVRNSLKLIKATIENHKIKLVIKVDKDIFVKGYPNEFSQVILNIVNNAKDAIVERNPDDRKVYVYTELFDGFVDLYIEDTAGGIPEDIIDKVFEPYFSTKANTGTGLGLYIAKLIVEKYMNGKIDVSNSEKGAKFRIRLPVFKG